MDYKTDPAVLQMLKVSAQKPLSIKDRFEQMCSWVSADVGIPKEKVREQLIAQGWADK